MPRKTKKTSGGKKGVEAFTHTAEAKRKNIPTAETQSFLSEEEAAPGRMRYPRNPDLDPQLVWRGKDAEDGRDLVVDTVPIYIQEKIHPRVLVEDIRRRSERLRAERREKGDGAAGEQLAMEAFWSDFNGLDDPEAAFEFYEHEKNWTNRMILGDSLLVMNSLAEKEALKGQVQLIYFDPPYGIKFNSNWQPSTKNRNVQDGKLSSAVREPEVLRAFRDTWGEGVHSYLSYLRDRVNLAKELLTETGAIFFQIGEENVHFVKCLLDEVFGVRNFVSIISFTKTSAQTDKYLASVCDYILFYAKNLETLKYNSSWGEKEATESMINEYRYLEEDSGLRRTLSSDELKTWDKVRQTKKVFTKDNLTSNRPPGSFPVLFRGRNFVPRSGFWKTGEAGFGRLLKADRVDERGIALRYVRFFDDFPVVPRSNHWADVKFSSRKEEKIYVVQSASDLVARCLLMSTDPGDLVLDPTCGSGTTAYVAEQWGRRWITVDTSRVALALARQRLMAARFPYYLLKDSAAGARKEGEVTGKVPAEGPFHERVRRGFVYERVPHITLKSIAHNAEIDVIWEKWQEELEPLRERLNGALEEAWEEWEVQREADAAWPAEAKKAHTAWWQARRGRQEEIDASIARNADTEFLTDRPYEDKAKVRVTGPFTVESLSPHRVLSPDDEDEALLRALEEKAAETGEPLPARTRSVRPGDRPPDGDDDFVRVVLDNLRKAGVQNTKKGERLEFTELKPWAGGRYVHAEGRYQEAGREKRVAVTIGPEYGTVSWGLVRDAAKEAVELFDTLVVCGFAFEPQVNEESLARFGRLTVLKARMNQDLHMAEHLRSTGAGNLFVVFGEPDIRVETLPDGEVKVEILGIDVFDPTTGEVRASSVDDVACWFVDTDYDGESFFVRQAYFLGGNDPYQKLKTTLKAEIDEDAWASLYSAESRPFPAPATGRIAVKVINHYGDEVLKVYEVG